MFEIWKSLEVTDSEMARESFFRYDLIRSHRTEFGTPDTITACELPPSRLVVFHVDANDLRRTDSLLPRYKITTHHEQQ
jgi:hypothetical protein